MNWIKVTEQLPPHGKPVLATYIVEYNKKPAFVIALRFERFKEEANSEDDNDEYNEADDTYYVQAGWYEQQRNWSDYSSIHIHEGEVTHWADLPKPPDGETNIDRGEA